MLCYDAEASCIDATTFEQAGTYSQATIGTILLSTVLAIPELAVDSLRCEFSSPSAAMRSSIADSTATVSVSPSRTTITNGTAPSPPSFANLLSSSPPLPLPELISTHLHDLYAYLSSFTYNNTPGSEHTPHIQAIKSQPLRHITLTARQIIHRRQPIRCLEAVVVALHLLAATEAEVAERCDGVRLLRYPLRFYSTCGGHCYWHILLVVALGPLLPSPSPSSTALASLPAFGAVSLSRHTPLSMRSLTFGSLSALCSSIRDEYGRIGHSLLQMTVGLPVTTNERSRAALDWHFLALHLPASKQHNHDTHQLPTSPSADDTTQSSAAVDGADDIPTSQSLVAVTAGDSATVMREWRAVCDVLDRYAARAVEYTAQVTINRQRPALARPLAPLHPQCHFDPHTQQFKYDGTTAKRAEKVRTQSTNAATTGRVQKKAGTAVAGRDDRSGSAATECVVLARLTRRQTLPMRRTADRAAFAV